MSRLEARVPCRGRASSNGRKSGVRSRCNTLICIVLLCMFAFCNVGLGQAESKPPRPAEATNPWPWFLAFIFVGVACFPAFKNSKRETPR